MINISAGLAGLVVAYEDVTSANLFGVPLPVFNTLSIVGLWGFIAFMVISRKLVWHTDLRRLETTCASDVKRAEDRADKWEDVALRLLGVSEKLTVSAEVANEVLTRLPDPGRTQAGDSP